MDGGAVRRAVLGACLAALAAAAPAQAGTARLVTQEPSDCRYGGCETRYTVRFDGARGERNDVSVMRGPAGALVVHDAAAPLDVRGGCARIDANSATCRGDAALLVYGGDGDDALALEGVAGTVSGGRGADRLAGSGEADVLSGGPGDDDLRGGAGGDRLIDGANAAAGGASNDDSFDGGDGIDWLEYRRRVEPVTVRLDDPAARSGPAGERDRIAGVESVAGGLASDRLVGDDGFNQLVGGGGPGADVLDGRGGDDQLHDGARMYGGNGRDRFGPPVGWYGSAPAILYGGVTRIACGPDEDSVVGTPPNALVGDGCETLGDPDGDLIRHHLPLASATDPVLTFDRDGYPDARRVVLRASGIAPFRRHPRPGAVLARVDTGADPFDVRLSERGVALLRRFGAIRVRVVLGDGRAGSGSYLIDLRLPPGASAG
jgi:hypothetical protein